MPERDHARRPPTMAACLPRPAQRTITRARRRFEGPGSVSPTRPRPCSPPPKRASTTSPRP
eukprot:101914-Chlamydomonas_euryale.AAC.1